jgi:hypothetical protein
MTQRNPGLIVSRLVTLISSCERVCGGEFLLMLPLEGRPSRNDAHELPCVLAALILLIC